MATSRDIQSAVERALAERDAKADVERQRQLDEIKARQEQEWVDSFLGGPCRYCGVTTSSEIVDGKQIPRWYEDSTVCAWCNDNRRPIGFTVSDIEHKERVVRSLVKPDIARRHIGHYLVDQSGFKWFSETPGAKPHPTKRFAFTSGIELEQRLLPPKDATLYSKRGPCQRCGCDFLWTQDGDPPELYTRAGMQLVRSTNRQPTFTCRGCSSFGPTDADYRNGIARLLVGVDGANRRMEPITAHGGTARQFGPSRSYTELLNIKLWRQTGAPAGTPFNYLDRHELRRKAFGLVPRRYWVRKDLWQEQFDAQEIRIIERYQEGKRREAIDGARARVAQRSV